MSDLPPNLLYIAKGDTLLIPGPAEDGGLDSLEAHLGIVIAAVSGLTEPWVIHPLHDDEQPAPVDLDN